MAFLKASESLPHAPESLAFVFYCFFITVVVFFAWFFVDFSRQIIPKALTPDRSQRPYTSELFRIVESEKRILDMAHVLGFFI